MGTVKCCQVPNVSTNFISTIFAPCLRAVSITLLGLLIKFSVVHVMSFSAAPLRQPCLSSTIIGATVR